MLIQWPNLCSFLSLGTEEPKDALEEIYIDRECMESRMDWMKSELNKVIREMERKSMSHHLTLCTVSFPPMPCLTCPLFPSGMWWEQA